MVLYLDDGIGTAPTYKLYEQDATVVKSTLEQAGFVLNVAKSNWVPSKQATWLGVEVNTETGTLKIPDQRVTKLLTKITSCIARRRASIRTIASVTGGIISLTIVLGNITSLFSREMYHFVAAHHAWDRQHNLNIYIITELRFWSTNLHQLNTRYFSVESAPAKITCTGKSDTSNVACGAHLKVGDQVHVAHKKLSAIEAAQSSTWRELDAVLYAMHSFTNFIRGKSITWETDNQAVPTIVHKGSSIKVLHQLAVQLYYLCRGEGILLDIRWIPRNANIFADQIRKHIDHDDWQTTTTFFRFLDSKWGPHIIDRFAADYNTKTARFNSLFWTPLCEAVDAISQDWKADTNWLVPPMYLIPKVINHARACHASGTLIAPHWPSSPYWPMLFLDQLQTNSFVLDLLVLHDPLPFLQLGRNRKSLLGSRRLTSPLLA